MTNKACKIFWCVEEIQESGCSVLWLLEGNFKPCISTSLSMGVSRLFEHEKLARPSDSGHYVVATRLFRHSWTEWDVVQSQRQASKVTYSW